MKRIAIVLGTVLAILMLGSPRALAVSVWSSARFEEGSAGDILLWRRVNAGSPEPTSDVIGNHNAMLSEDVPLALISDDCLPNRSSLRFSEGTVAVFEGPFVFELPQGDVPEETAFALEFWIKLAEPQEASIVWTETAGEDANRFNIYVTGTSMGGEFRAGTLVHISNGTHDLPLDRWVHVGIIRRGPSSQHTYRWYFDGIEDTGMRTSVSGMTLPYSEAWTIGGRPGYPFRGWIDEVSWGGGLENPPIGPQNVVGAQDFLNELPDHCPSFKRGDANVDGAVNLFDATFSFDYLFKGEGVPVCMDALDANDSGSVDIADPIFTLTYLFEGTVTIPPPGVDSCGQDLTPDHDGDLGCEYPTAGCDVEP